MVYRAAFLVAADADQELAGIRLTFTNEADQHDEDFCGHAKVCQPPAIADTGIHAAAMAARHSRLVDISPFGWVLCACLPQAVHGHAACHVHATSRGCGPNATYENIG